MSNDSPWPYVLLYKSLGLNLLPLRFGSKKPIESWKIFQQRLETEDELTTWFKRQVNIGIICCKVSGGLLIQDFERYKDYAMFFDPRKIEAETIVVTTPHGGVHVYLRTRDNVRRSIRICEEPPLDLLGDGGYALAPPSVIDHGKCDKTKCNMTGTSAYRFISEARSILELENALASIKSRCSILGWRIKEPHPIRKHARGAEQGVWKHARKRKPLTKDRFNRLVQNITKEWQPGKRHYLALYFGGYFVKQGIREADALAIVKAVCELARDEETSDRIHALLESYMQSPENVHRLKGLSGLQELIT